MGRKGEQHGLGFRGQLGDAKRASSSQCRGSGWGKGAWFHQAKECGLKLLVGREPPGSFKKRKDWVGAMFLEGVWVLEAPSGGHMDGI